MDFFGFREKQIPQTVRASQRASAAAKCGVVRFYDQPCGSQPCGFESQPTGSMSYQSEENASSSSSLSLMKL